MRIRLRAILLTTIFLALAFNASLSQAGLIKVSIDTSAIAGSALKVVFDVAANTPGLNRVDILNFSAPGSTMGLPETTGGLVTGDLILGVNPAPFTNMETSAFFNEVIVNLTPVSKNITFTLSYTENVPAPDTLPDEIVFSLLDTSYQPLFATSDPLGTNSLFVVDLSGTSTTPVAFNPAVRLSSGDIQIKVPGGPPPPPPIPEPNSLSLAILALAIVFLTTGRTTLLIRSLMATALKINRRRLFGAFFIVLTPLSLFAQTLTLKPICGKPGDKICISGSGWAEPNPVCRYTFAFDGASVAPDQPDGLFGPPNTSFTVPAGASPGNHTVRVQLRLNSPDNLLQQKDKPFKVVSGNKDPWTQKSGAGGTMNVTFDPTDVCDIGPCDKIVFIQTKQPIGVKADNKTRPLTHAEQGWPNAAALDGDLSNGYSVDYVVGEADPYYNGDDPQDGTQQGVQGTPPKAATMDDTPNRADGNYPADIAKIRLSFEVNAFCAVGEIAGKYLGRVFWTWERAKGASGTTGTISGISSDRGTPSASATAALAKWATNHGNFAVPQPKPSSCP